MKKLMILGGSRYAVPVIEAAHKLGIYVITCDYLPGNYAHRFSDEYVNVSIIDQEAVLEKAKQLNIDGICSFGCDPGVVTAAYVAEKLGLPGAGPYESVCILQNKGRFRKFLTENGFNVPTAKSYSNIEQAIAEADKFHWPIIVKPTDSAGSKGVTKVECRKDLEVSIKNALESSHCKEFIIEDFIRQKGFSSDSECFSVDGNLAFVSFSSQRFDAKAINPYTPAAFSWPSQLSKAHQEELQREIQRLISLLNMKTSIYNVESRVGYDGKAYIMEVSPRGGGNRLAECIRFATGIDLIENTVRAAVGFPLLEMGKPEYTDIWAEVILHSNASGFFRDLIISEEIKPFIREVDLWVKPGEPVQSFQGANTTIGTVILCFNCGKTMEHYIDSPAEYLTVRIQEKVKE